MQVKLQNMSETSYNAVVAQYSTLSRIARIAEDQWGLITRRQAEGTGVSQATLQRLAKAGILDRVAHGVYRVAGAPWPELDEVVVPLDERDQSSEVEQLPPWGEIGQR